MTFNLIAPRHPEHREEYMLHFDEPGRPGCGWGFDCDKAGNLLNATPTRVANLAHAEAEAAAGRLIRVGVVDYSRDVMIGEERRSDCCNAVAYFSRSCGAWVCDRCDNHDGLARCFCGWSASGRRNGRRELVEMGENLDDDDGFFYSPEAGW